MTWLSRITKGLCSGIALLTVAPIPTWASASSFRAPTEAAGGGSVTEPEPDLVTVLLTTPTQEQFTVGAPSGSLVQVTNNQTGEQFAFYMAHANGGAAGSLTPDSRANRKKPELFSLRLFRIDSSDQGSVLSLLTAVDQLRPGEEFVEPKTGFTFRPLSAAEGKERWSQAEASSSLTWCCVDCGFYTICAPRVSGCGNGCINYFGDEAAFLKWRGTGCPEFRSLGTVQISN